MGEKTGDDQETEWGERMVERSMHEMKAWNGREEERAGSLVFRKASERTLKERILEMAGRLGLTISVTGSFGRLFVSLPFTNYIFFSFF